MRTRYAPLAALLLTSVLCLSACLSGSDPDPKEPSSDTWPELVECVADKIPSAIDQITEALLAGSDPTQALVELAEVHGFDVVACGVSQLVDDWTSPGATQSPERMGAVHRGRAFLEREGIEVKTVSGERSSYQPIAPLKGYVHTVYARFDAVHEYRDYFPGLGMDVRWEHRFVDEGPREPTVSTDGSLQNNGRGLRFDGLTGRPL